MMIEVNSDYQFLFSLFGISAALCFFVAAFFTLRLIYFALIKINSQKVWKSSLAICISLCLMFALWGIAFNVQYVQATTFSDINYRWGAIGGGIGGTLGIFVVGAGLMYERIQGFLITSIPDEQRGN